MIVLDTNVLAELMRPAPDPGVLAWADQLDPQTVAITAMNEAELLHGLARLPEGQRRTELQSSWDTLRRSLFAGRVLPFDSDGAHWYGALLARRERLGRPMACADAVIAAICLAHQAPLATRNGRDFEALGLTLIDPWSPAAPAPD